MRFLLATVALALLTVSAALADVIELKTGQRIEGTLKQATPASVSVDIAGQTVTFEGEKVRAVYFGVAPSGNLRAASTVPGDAIAANAIQTLKGLRSVTGAGIVYREYATRVLDAKPKVDQYLEGAEPSKARDAVDRTMRYHVAASTAWNAALVKDISGFNGLEARLAGCRDDLPPKTPGPLDRITGCSYTAARYAVSVDNVMVLRSFKGQSVLVGPFTAADPGRTSIGCRGGSPVEVPGREPFEAYFRKALLDELTLAELYAPDAPVTLTGHMESIDFTSGIMITGAWTIAMSLRSSNGKMLSVQHVHEFQTAYIGDVACGRVAAALAPATQELITKFVRHPLFPALLQRP